MYGTMSMEVLEQRRKEMVQEAASNRQKKALRAEHNIPAIHQGASIAAWKLARTADVLREYFRMPKNAD